MRFTLALIGTLLMAVACTGEPISKRVGPGSTVTVTLPELLPGVTPGYGSLLAGSDAQRGSVSFVLCAGAFPGCDPSPTLSPRQGYRVTTTYLTRAQADQASRSAGVRLVGAVIDIPALGDHVPAPGVYRLEPRLLAPNANTEVAMVPESAVRTLEIVAGAGIPSPQVETATHLMGVIGGVPRPAVAIVRQAPSGQTAATSAELEIQIPDAKVSIAGVSAGPEAAMVDMVALDAQTVRVLWMARSGATSSAGSSTIELQFELQPGAAPALASEFTIVSERAYDSSGVLLAGTQFAVDRIF
jgi:hypothetical protein